MLPDRDHQSHYISADGLSGACIPAKGRPFEFDSGYRTGVYHDEDSADDLLELEAAVPSGNLCAVFFEMVSMLEDEVDVVLNNGHLAEFSEQTTPNARPEYLMLREQIHNKVLLQILHRYERFLLFDGNCSLTVFGSSSAGSDDPTEIRLEDDKVIYVIATDLAPVEAILRAWNVPPNQEVAIVSDGAHLHYWSETTKQLAVELILELDADPAVRTEG